MGGQKKSYVFFKIIMLKSMDKSAYFKYFKFTICVCFQIPQECMVLCYPQDLLLLLRCKLSEFEGYEHNQRNILNSQSQEG